MDLSQYNEKYEQSEIPETGSGDNVPDGKYQCYIEFAEVRKSKSGKPMVSYQFRVASGPHENRCIFKNDLIEDKRIPYIKKDMETLQIILKEFSDLPDAIGDCIDSTVEVQKKTKIKNGKEFENVYINSLVNARSGWTDPEPNETQPQNYYADAKEVSQENDGIPF